jgi:hypothetical protein
MGQDSVSPIRFTLPMERYLIRNNLTRGAGLTTVFVMLSNTPGLLCTAGGSFRTWNGLAAGIGRRAALPNLPSATVSAKNKTGAPPCGAAVFP